MSDNPRPSAPQAPSGGNPETLARFRRESWWQITFPVLFVAALGVAGVVLLIVYGGPAGVSIVADYSLLLLIIPWLIAGLLVLAAFAGLIYLSSKLIRSTPPYTYAAQKAMHRVYTWVDRQMNRIAGVVIFIRSLLVGLEVYLKEKGFLPGDDGDSQPDAPAD